MYCIEHKKFYWSILNSREKRYLLIHLILLDSGLMSCVSWWCTKWLVSNKMFWSMVLTIANLCAIIAVVRMFSTDAPFSLSLSLSPSLLGSGQERTFSVQHYHSAADSLLYFVLWRGSTGQQQSTWFVHNKNLCSLFLMFFFFIII